MDSDLAQLQKLLAANGFAVVRQRKHVIYKNKAGRIWVTPFTPSDTHAFKNNLAQFKKFLAVGIVKQATRNLGITALERRRADGLLRPERVRPRRDPKPRRVAVKRFRPVGILPAPRPSERKQKESYFDAYTFGSRIRRELDNSLAKAWPIVTAAVVTAWREKTIKQCDAMKRAERDTKLIQNHADRERAEALHWWRAMNAALPKIVNGCTRVLQRAVHQHWARESEAEKIDAELQKVFRRYFPGQADMQNFEHTAAWIMKLMPKFSNGDTPPRKGEVRFSVESFGGPEEPCATESRDSQ